MEIWIQASHWPIGLAAIPVLPLWMQVPSYFDPQVFFSSAWDYIVSSISVTTGALKFRLQYQKGHDLKKKGNGLNHTKIWDTVDTVHKKWGTIGIKQISGFREMHLFPGNHGFSFHSSNFPSEKIHRLSLGINSSRRPFWLTIPRVFFG